MGYRKTQGSINYSIVLFKHIIPDFPLKHSFAPEPGKITPSLKKKPKRPKRGVRGKSLWPAFLQEGGLPGSVKYLKWSCPFLHLWGLNNFVLNTCGDKTQAYDKKTILLKPAEIADFD
jgi:hypothetical protein